jgi:hypothetical protein
VVQADKDTPQTVRLLPSTSLGQTYMIAKTGCLESWKTYSFPDSQDCDESRGKLYKDTTHVIELGQQGEEYAFQTKLKKFKVFSLFGIDESEVQYWFDHLTFGYKTDLNDGKPGHTSAANVPLGIMSDGKYSWTGLLGIDPRPLNYTLSVSGREINRKSLLQTLRDARDIPSLSWSYHAGSQGRKFSSASST